jgi:hypothetical protein
VAGYVPSIFNNQSEKPYTDALNLAHLLVGSEGTLALTKSLTKLSELPCTKVLGVVNLTSTPLRTAQHIVSS